MGLHSKTLGRVRMPSQIDYSISSLHESPDMQGFNQDLWKFFYAANKQAYLSVCALGNQTAEASVSEIKSMWEEKQKELAKSPAEPE